MTWLLSFITGGGLKGIAQEIAEWDIKRREAKNDEARVYAEQVIEQLKARQSVLVEETKYASTRWIRPAFATICIVFWGKVVIWDTVFGWGVTPYPGDMVAWFVTLIPTAYFLTRPFEKWRKR